MKSILLNSKLSGSRSERLAMNIIDSDNSMIHFYENDTNSVYLWNGSSWIDVTIPVDVIIPPFEGTLFYSSAAVYQITSNLQDYSDWTFQIVGSGADTILIEGSLNGTDFTPIPILRLVANTVSVAGIATEGLFKIAPVASGSTKPMILKAIKVTKVGTAGTKGVYGTAGWAA